jgi:Na+/H+ antiporter NhaD/arsenite permease-like protein
MVDNMEWFNVFGLIFIAVIMIPNVVFAIKCKDGFDNKWNNKYVEVTEQVGRLGCFGFMIINIPGTWFGWWSDEAFASALIDNIPFAATMVPVIKSLAATQGVDLSVLAWALSMGTDVGGSATPIGASANVVGTSVAAKNGYMIGWGKYCRTAVPATIIVVLISMVCIFVRYC